MSRYQQASHVFWRCIQLYCAPFGCQVVELNVQLDYVQLVSKVAPKVSISSLRAALKGKGKGKIALKLFSKFPYLTKSKYGESFLATRLFRRSSGNNQGLIRRYVWH
jgi:putative transposase